ncbi:Cys-Cys-COOH (seleno)protein SaoC [Dehalobacterium formicoaceticum]|uniref:Cys-Cys-COOH protein SaoC n=1 Tax=Dehalobacterium formicoaceticum TaxID=51515 RepID=A0ABT1Y6I6_9FIRM|nr:Cys-Cys-COOH (seleno)protein SaoC [Dehalobacterium formicoaceticum]MCR6546502.1 Cys-Cys-COOH protein SaoC [Dehalobacterium formicoaceticum]
MNNKFLKNILSIIIVVAVAFAAKQYLEAREERKYQDQTAWMGGEGKDFAVMVPEDNRALQYFKEEFPAREVILACAEDITDDQLQDLLVIYRENEHTRLAALIDKGEGHWYISPEIPAPIENQTIRFKNIDKEAEMEFIITGEKEGAVGYAVYRMIDGEIKDLFGEGMADCC